MAGYSGTPLPKKLGIKANHRVALLNAPQGFAESLIELPEAVTLSADLKQRQPWDVILFFTDSKKQLQREFKKLARRITPSGGLWISWPKKASGVTTDLVEDTVRKIGLEAGLVDNKICAVDDTWSGLRFVYRLVDRAPR